MNKVYCFTFILLICPFLSFTQTVVLGNTDKNINILFRLPNASLEKLVDAVYIKVTYLDGHNFKKDTIINTNNIYCSGFYRLPTQILGRDILSFRYKVMFKSTLEDYFNKGDTSLFNELGLSPHEIKTLAAIAGNLPLGISSITRNQWEEKRVIEPDGTIKKIIVTKEIVINRHYYFAQPASVINCMVSTKPAGADVYVIPKDTWLFKLQLSFPPTAKEITADVKQKLFQNKIGNTQNPIALQLNEMAYVVLFDNRGNYSFEHLEPSTVYKDRNILNAVIK